MNKKPTTADKAKALDGINKTKGSDDSVTENKLSDTLSEQYQAGWDNFSTIRASWDDKESMLIGTNRATLTGTTKSQVNDQRLSTIVIERAARVMAQLPSGKVQALTQKDTGKNTLMNLIVSKYIYPNARAQFDLLTKFRMWDVYSDVYGSMPLLVDYRIDDDYIGPDCYLTPIRNFIAQPGRISIQDSDHAFIDTWVSVAWLKKRNPKFWKNLDWIIKEAEKGGTDRASQDSAKRSLVERNRYPNVGGGKGDSAMVCLSTRYERDRWVTFAPDYADRDKSNIVRDIENPQHNNRIPIVMKHCFPLLDSIIGLGEFERGKTIQFAMNSLINLYLDGVKMSIFPPIMIDATGVVPSTIKFNPAAKWLVTKGNAIQPFPVNPQGMQTFQSTYSFLISSLLNMAGTTDTSVTAQTDPGMGKTPDAIKMLSARESARDNWDRFMMEKAIEETMDIMVDMVATKQEKPIEFNLFEDEIKQIKRENPDVLELLGKKETYKAFDSKKAGKVSITSEDVGKTKYKYFIDSGTSMKQDDDKMNQTATMLLETVIKNPQLIDAMKQSATPRTVDIGELFEVIVNTSGLPNANKIVVDLAEKGQGAPAQPQQPGMPQMPPELAQAMGGAQAGGGNPLMPQQPQPQQPAQPTTPPSELPNYKDAPEDIRRQMEEKAGFQPSQVGNPAAQPLHSENLINQHMQQNPPAMSEPFQAPQAPQPPTSQDMGAPGGGQPSVMHVGGFQFKNPEIAQLAQQMGLGGGNGIQQ